MVASASPHSPGFAGLVSTLKGCFPDFAGFDQPDSEFYQRERAYKDELVERFRQTIRPLLDVPQGDSASALFLALLDLLTKALPSGGAQNLVSFWVATNLRRLPANGRAEVCRLVHDLLRGPDSVFDRLDRFGPACLSLLHTVSQQGPAGVRSLATFLLMLDDPISNIAVRFDTFNAVSVALTGTKLIAHGAKPDGGEYRRTLDLVKQVRTDLTKESWPPRDMIDVQSFIWVAGGGYGQEEPLPEPLTADKITPLPSLVQTTNLILYGPPGTGKTFATAAEAVRLCDGAVPPEHTAVRARYEALVKAGQVRFVTFHQSFSYEDFIEGLRPVTGEDGVDGPGFRLEPKNGVFRDMTSEATQAYEAAKRNERSIGYDLSNRRFWKFALGNSNTENDVFQGALKGDYVVLGWGYDVDWSDLRFESLDAMKEEWARHYPDDKKPSQTQQPWLLRNKMKVGDIVIVPAGNTKFRAVAEVTGSYEFKLGPDGEYSQRRAVKWLVRPEAPLALADIVEGDFTMRALYEINPARIRTEALARLIKVPVSTPVRPDQFVLIIDEINRGNISKIFGELLTLLEPDKRLDAENQVSVRLPYSGEPFTVPPNLHVIGTMNTADRSIALLDTALRRRFDFRELMPEPSRLDLVDGIDLAVVLRTLNDRIEYLFDREHQIGHAFFMGCQSRADIDAVMCRKIIPLLAEYFFEDWSKVATVLGGEEGNGFLDRKQLVPPKGFEDEGATRIRWSVKAEFDYGRLLQP